MKMLLLGANGQVGWELQRALAPLGQLEIHDRNSADLMNFERLRSLVQQAKPDVIVNAAAYTAVDQAETESETAYRINAEAVSALAEEAKKLDACLVHYSTDYVFDGTKIGAYIETDETNPQSVYGSSKLAGEKAITASGCQHLIFRTSWVFASRGNNFAKTMLKLAQEKDKIKVVADQVGAPTSAELIADVTALAIYNLQARILTKSALPSSPRGRESSSITINDEISGIYHLVASGEVSWHGFAKHVITHAEKLGMSFKVKSDNIMPIITEQFPRPAIPPLNSRMDTGMLRGLLGIELPVWTFHVERMIREIMERGSWEREVGSSNNIRKLFVTQGWNENDKTTRKIGRMDIFNAIS